jgi:polyisoprenoid-binding protein YceI
VPTPGGTLPKFDASNAETLVFTYKEGVLSPLAHDLVLRVASFEVEFELGSGHVSARFDADSLVVVDAAKNGEPVHGTLKDKDKRQIEENIRKDVLHSKRFEAIRFVGSHVEPQNDGFRIDGKLHLHGKQREMHLVSRAQGDMQVIEATIHQPDFGIRPFTAMMGTLKVKPDIKVCVALPIKNG